VPEHGPARLEEVLAILRALPDRDEDLADDLLPLLEVRLLLPRPEPALRARLDEAVEGRNVRLVRWQASYTGDEAGLGDRAEGAALADLDPVQVFKQRWTTRHEGQPPPPLLAAFDELLAQARDEAGVEVEP